MKVLALLGQLKHSRIDNGQTTIIAEELAKGGQLYKKEVFFNIFIKLPNFILFFIPTWLLIKHIDDFKDINECDFIVISGKKMVKYAKHIRKYAFPNAKIVQIGNPYCSLRKSDILIRQNTSRYVITCKNTIMCRGVICKKIDGEISSAECKKFEKIKNILKGDYIGVFIGGNTVNYRFTIDNAISFAKNISNISFSMKMPLLISTDKGVSDKIVDIIKQNLDCSYYFYNRNANPEENPKIAFMSFAKFYILIGNSISDHSEYISQEKPVYLYLCDNNTKRYIKFITEAEAKGCIRILNKDMHELEFFQPNNLNDIKDIVQKIKAF